MIDSEDYPLMTVGELARALGVPREFVFAHAHELGAICLRLRDANGRASAKFTQRTARLVYAHAHELAHLSSAISAYLKLNCRNQVDEFMRMKNRSLTVSSEFPGTVSRRPRPRLAILPGHPVLRLRGAFYIGSARSWCGSFGDPFR